MTAQLHIFDDFARMGSQVAFGFVVYFGDVHLGSRCVHELRGERIGVVTGIGDLTVHDM